MKDETWALLCVFASLTHSAYYDTSARIALGGAAMTYIMYRVLIAMARRARFIK